MHFCRLPKNKLSLNANSSVFALIFVVLLMYVDVLAQSVSQSSAVTPDFWLKSETGKFVNVAEQKSKVVFINFWATTCIPCKTEMQTINLLHLHFKDDTNILVLPVDLDHDFPASTEFMHVNKLDLTVYTTAGVVPEAWFHGVLPTTIVIDRNGHMALYHEGDSDYSSKKFIAFVDSLRRN